MLCTGRGKAEEDITAIASAVAARSSAELTADKLEADVVLRTVDPESGSWVIV
jgi:hypothetical protein